jgi:hypothetical protein
MSGAAPREPRQSSEAKTLRRPRQQCRPAYANRWTHLGQTGRTPGVTTSDGVQGELAEVGESGDADPDEPQGSRAVVEAAV